MAETYMNRCYRSGSCLFGIEKEVDRAGYWDYYDTRRRKHIFLECRLHQKYYSPSVLEIEEADKFYSGLSTSTFEHPDLQLADQNGKWMTRSDDPECYHQQPYEEAKTCNDCDIICEIRDRPEYLLEDGTCPYNDAPPSPIYWGIKDNDTRCGDFLHPLLLQDIDAINRKRRRMAKAKIWKHLQQPRWMHALINSGQTMKQVWERNYQPVTFYYRSFETILLYLKNLPREQKTSSFLRLVRRNIESSPSYRTLLKDEHERGLLQKIHDLR